MSSSRVLLKFFSKFPTLHFKMYISDKKDIFAIVNLEILTGSSNDIWIKLWLIQIDSNFDFHCCNKNKNLKFETSIQVVLIKSKSENGNPQSKKRHLLLNFLEGQFSQTKRCLGFRDENLKSLKLWTKCQDWFKWNDERAKFEFCVIK